jgi:hypothetical protein
VIPDEPGGQVGVVQGQRRSVPLSIQESQEDRNGGDGPKRGLRLEPQLPQRPLLPRPRHGDAAPDGIQSKPDGPDGSVWPDGPDGSDGSDGSDGPDGSNVPATQPQLPHATVLPWGPRHVPPTAGGGHVRAAQFPPVGHVPPDRAVHDPLQRVQHDADAVVRPPASPVPHVPRRDELADADPLRGVRHSAGAPVQGGDHGEPERAPGPARELPRNRGHHGGQRPHDPGAPGQEQDRAGGVTVSLADFAVNGVVPGGRRLGRGGQRGQLLLHPGQRGGEAPQEGGALSGDRGTSAKLRHASGGAARRQEPPVFV